MNMQSNPSGINLLLSFDQFKVLTFDCYGTLIDWESGILSAVRPVLSEYGVKVSDEEILKLYAKFESESESGEYMKYREILRTVAINFARRYNFDLPEEMEQFIADSVKNWLPFSDTVAALKTLKNKYRLGILSNTDNVLFSYSAKHLAVDFDFIFTSEDIGSYKPSRRNFVYALDMIGVPKENLLHVAQSLYHDVAVANSLGISTVWVNRRHDKSGYGATPERSELPDLEVPDLKTLVESIGH